jgi:hypothetical protein
MSDEYKRINVSVAGFTDEDWRLWRTLYDFEQQYEILREQKAKIGRGLLEGVVERELAMLDDGGDARKAWKRLSAGERAELLLRILQERDVVRVFALGNPRDREYYITFGNNNILLSLEKWGADVLDLLFGSLVCARARAELLGKLRSMAQPIDWSRVDPPHAIRLRDAVLRLDDLSVVRIEDGDEHYFRYYAPVFTRPGSLSLARMRIEEIKRGDYSVELNPVYRYFRSRFSDEDWNYLIDALGTILSPYRFKLIVFLIGETNVGKSTLLRALMRPIEPLVAWVQLGTLLNYTFGLESLVGKQVLVSTERGDAVLVRWKVDLLNRLFGESDVFEVPRKFKPPALVTSLKVGIIAMNDPPIINEYGGETMMAFAERLSIVRMHKPEGEEGVKGRVDILEKIPPEEAFNFLLWCRWQLEQRGWEVRKMDAAAVLDYLRMQTNPVLRFLSDEMNDSIEEHPDGRIQGDELYAIFVRYCQERGIAPVSKNDFYTVIAARYQKYYRDGRVWFKGIRRKERGGDTYEHSRFFEQ